MHLQLSLRFLWSLSLQDKVLHVSTVMFLWYLEGKHGQQVFPMFVLFVKATIEKRWKEAKEEHPIEFQQFVFDNIKDRRGSQKVKVHVCLCSQGFHRTTSLQLGSSTLRGDSKQMFLISMDQPLTESWSFFYLCPNHTAWAVWLYPGGCCPTNSGSLLYHMEGGGGRHRGGGGCFEAVRPSLVASYLNNSETGKLNGKFIEAQEQMCVTKFRRYLMASLPLSH